MTQAPVLISGAGIGGLSLALTLQQIGVPCRVLESVADLKPLGVGINLQPNAVRELYELGVGAAALDSDRHPDARMDAGQPQRPRCVLRTAGPAGRLPLAAVLGAPREVADAALRCGPSTPGCRCHPTGVRVIGYRHRPRGDGIIALLETRTGERLELAGSLLIAADGLHSAVRQQMHPRQPPIQWGGAIMWRGVTVG